MVVHGFFITNIDELYVNGINKWGQLGLIDHDLKEVKGIIRHNYFNDDNVSILPQMLSHGTSNQHSFIYTSDNILYAFGKNTHKQLGMDTISHNSKEPIMIKYEFDSILIQIVCGKLHTMFLTLYGTVYGCGSNEYNQLSFKFSTVKYTIKKLESLKNIKQIGCTKYTSFCLNNMGTLFSFGNNKKGELGSNNISDTNNINKINGIKCINIQCGSHHIGCLNNFGILYMFGNNRYTQCGYKVINDALDTPTKVDISHSITDIKLGGYHTIIKANNGNYFSFGYNYNKECCLLNRKDRPTVFPPTKIPIKALQEKIQNFNDIIDIIPVAYQTFILQQI